MNSPDTYGGGNPNWYCKMVEFRAAREDDLHEVGCDQCGYREHLWDRRWPSIDIVNHTLERGCTCE